MPEYKDFYYKVLNEIISNYDEDIFLLMQCGDFYQIHCSESHPESVRLFKIFLNITGLNGTELSGFQTYLLDEKIRSVIDSGYSVIVYDQYPEKLGDSINITYSRKFKAHYSSGSFFTNNEEILTNYTTCIWVHYSKFSNENVFGISSIDIISGNVIVNETKVMYFDNPTTYDDIEKHITIYKPSELIIIYDRNRDEINKMISYINPNSNRIKYIDLNDNTIYSRQSTRCKDKVYQKETIKYFYSKKMEIIYDDLNKSEICLRSLCFVLNYLNNYNTNLIKEINSPIMDKSSENVLLANQTLTQLDIFNNRKGNNSNILSLLNECKTPVGRREFRRYISIPTTDISKLNESYDLIEHMILNDIDFSNILINIDMERIRRKIIIGNSNLKDLHDIYRVATTIKDYNYDETIKNYINYSLLVDVCDSIIGNYKEVFNTDVNYGTKEDNNLINRNYNNDLDSILKEKMEVIDKLRSICIKLNSMFHGIMTPSSGEDIKEVFKLTISKVKVFIEITNKRSQTFTNYIKKNKVKSIEIKYKSSYDDNIYTFSIKMNLIEFIKLNKASSYLRGDIIDKLYDHSIILNDLYNNKVDEIISEYSKNISHKYLLVISNTIKDLDMLNCKKIISDKYKCIRPTIEEMDESFLDIKQLRHLLIEQIETNEMYVKNDIRLSSEGILLFGTNAVGKTSLIKAIGICIIMAQCGLYVPCGSMKYSPYSSIFTRIIGNDNIFKGLSTFEVEMCELRVILKYCNKNSLILGDEVCSGTELLSGSSIFTATLITLSKVCSSYIFATHFHNIVDSDDFKSIRNINCKHLTVTYDNKHNTLIYDRILKDGCGEQVYGLEVCKSLDLPSDFLELAFTIRNKKTNILDLDKSRYNNSKLKNKCEICGKPSEEVHHLIHQKNMRDDINKNHASNLYNLCSKCHDNIHKEGFEYEIRKTIDGKYILVYKID